MAYASEWIEVLQELVKKYGDHGVILDTGEELDVPEFNDDGEPAFVTGV